MDMPILSLAINHILARIMSVPPRRHQIARHSALRCASCAREVREASRMGSPQFRKTRWRSGPAQGRATNHHLIGAARPILARKWTRRGRAPPITKDAIFNYVYAVLQDPVYRDKYAPEPQARISAHSLLCRLLALGRMWRKADGAAYRIRDRRAVAARANRHKGRKSRARWR